MLPDSRLTRARLLTESRRSKAARRWPTAMDTDFLFAALMHWQAVRLCPVWVDFTHAKCHAGRRKKKSLKKSCARAASRSRPDQSNHRSHSFCSLDVIAAVLWSIVTAHHCANAHLGLNPYHKRTGPEFPVSLGASLLVSVANLISLFGSIYHFYIGKSFKFCPQIHE